MVTLPFGHWPLLVAPNHSPFKVGHMDTPFTAPNCSLPRVNHQLTLINQPVVTIPLTNHVITDNDY